MSANSLIVRVLKESNAGNLMASNKILNLVSPQSSYINSLNVDIFLAAPSFKYTRELFFRGNIKPEDVIRIINAVERPRLIVFDTPQPNEIHRLIKDLCRSEFLEILQLPYFDYFGQPNDTILANYGKYGRLSILVPPVKEFNRIVSICRKFGEYGLLLEFFKNFKDFMTDELCKEIETYTRVYEDEPEILKSIIERFENWKIYNTGENLNFFNFLLQSLSTQWSMFKFLNSEATLLDFLSENKLQIELEDTRRNLTQPEKLITKIFISARESTDKLRKISKIIEKHNFDQLINSTIMAQNLTAIYDFCENLLYNPGTLEFFSPKIISANNRNYLVERFSKKPDIKLMCLYLDRVIDSSLRTFFVKQGAKPPSFSFTIDSFSFLKQCILQHPEFARGNIASCKEVFSAYSYSIPQILSVYDEMGDLTDLGKSQFEKFIIDFSIKIQGIDVSLNSWTDFKSIEIFFSRFKKLGSQLYYDFIVRSAEKSGVPFSFSQYPDMFLTFNQQDYIVTNQAKKKNIDKLG